MNRILFEEQNVSYELNPRDPRFEHVRGVLRMRKGDVFDVGVVNGPAGKARIESLEPGCMRVTVDWLERPPAPPPISLIVGLCRPATARKILRTVPELGLRRLIFTPASRTDPAYAAASIWKDNEWRSRLLEGVEQAFDTYLPDVVVASSLEETVEISSGNGPHLALDVYEGTIPLSSITLEADGPVTLAVGPERGWAGSDRRRLREGGFELAALNERVLRVETAVVAGMTLILAGMGRL